MAIPQSLAWNMSQRSIMDDPSSPYFLHHSDNPGMILVSQQLAGDNFAFWSRSMKIALSVKNKLGFLDGSIIKPPASEVNLLTAWNRNNNIVISWLLNSVSNEISASILFAESALDIWNDLRECFEQIKYCFLIHFLRSIVFFALVIQEERQRTIGISSHDSSSSNGMIFAIKNEQRHKPSQSRNGQTIQRGRPYCTACHKPGHTVETCYKIHGYPPGYKHRTPTAHKNANTIVNQVSNISSVTETPSNGESSAINIFQNLDKTQMDQLMTLFVQHISTVDQRGTQSDGQSNSHVAAFISLKAVDNSRVTLPNNEHIDVNFSGDIRLGSYLTLSDDITTKKMIGKGSRVEGLYVLDTSNSGTTNFVNQVSSSVWHSRLGHPSLKSHMPIHFWGECVLTATYLVNRVPSLITQNKSPYELLYQKGINYSHLRVFGCLAFASTLAAHREKFLPRARTCVFIGYPPEMKGYKLHLCRSFPIVVFPQPAATCDLLSIETHANDISPPSSGSTAVRTAPTDIPSSSSMVPIRTSSRITRQPSYLRDYHCHLLRYNSIHSSTIRYPIHEYISYSSLSQTHKNFVLNVSAQFEPQFYHQAIKFPSWKAAMQEELSAMDANNTWSVVPLPLGKQPIGYKWVYKVKYK
ncbi:uncharacterized protein [Henckelia pumila]|uniref:uncharacterized protein n=1 Tax=Henckelia pumila TaxID=405737 RepID=UPI003C6E3589